MGLYTHTHPCIEKTLRSGQLLHTGNTHPIYIRPEPMDGSAHPAIGHKISLKGSARECAFANKPPMPTGAGRPTGPSA